MKSIFKSARYYHSRAVEAFAIAETMPTDGCKQVWKSIAEGYQALAETIDRESYDLDRKALAALRTTSVDLSSWVRGDDGEDRFRQRLSARQPG